MRFIKIIHFLSLDVALGALLFQLYFCRLFLGDFPHWPQIVIFFVSIWLIYLLDRRIDFQIQLPSDHRHIFQYNHRKQLNLLIVALFSFAISLVFFLPMDLIKFGFILVSGIGIYWGIWILGWFAFVPGLKEIFTAMIYTFGTGAVILFQESITLLIVQYFFLFFLLAFHNLLLFNALEKPLLVFWTPFIRVTEGVFIFFLLKIIFDNWNDTSLIKLSPLILTFCIQIWIHYFGFSLKSRLLGELTYFSPLIYFAYEFFSK
ncbi:hypothetical protein V7S76_02895 [Aquirufa sp. ROCK2-A2]